MAKKSLIVKPRIYEKVDEAFHGLFFNRGIVFDDSGLEIVVEESIPEPTKSTIKVIQPSLFSQASCQPVSTSNYAHTFKTRARYDTVDSNGKKLRKSTAFQSIEDQISWEQAQPLVDDYREKIANDLGNNNYKCTVEKGVVIIRSAVTKKEIKAVIRAYIKDKGGYLSDREVVELTKASMQDLEDIFGAEHSTIANRRYSVDDVLRISNRCTHSKDAREFRGAAHLQSNYYPSLNIMNIYRRAVKGSAAVNNDLFQEPPPITKN